MSLGLESYADAVALTKHDTTVVSCLGFYVGGAGNVTVVTEAGTSVLFTALPVGTIVPIRFTKLMSTGTTATAVVGFRRAVL